MAEMNPDLEKRFTYHRPKPDQKERYETIRQRFKDMAYFITENTPSSREQALAMTNLEQCLMWVNASIARNEA
jgi:hypothetical protein